jgi:hypothetical protein
MWARQHAPQASGQGKRSVKNKAKHVGVVLKGSTIQNQVHIETLFPAHKL